MLPKYCKTFDSSLYNDSHHATYTEFKMSNNNNALDEESRQL